MDFLLGASFFNISSFIFYALINFGLTVDNELVVIEKAGITEDWDDDGVLSWAGFRAAARKLHKKHVWRLRHAPASAQAEDVNCAAAPNAAGLGAAVGATRRAPTTLDACILDVAGMRRRITRQNTTSAVEARERRVCCLLSAFKPERVRHWKHGDRYLRTCFLPVFAVYVVAMLSLAERWEPATLPWAEANSCK